MRPSTSQPLTLLERGLADPRVSWALGAAVAAVGVALALDPAWLHDEGLLSYGFARALGDDPLAMLFFQKCKPVGALVYALPARLGIGPFLVAHAIVPALAVPLSASAAQAMGARRPNLAALTIAASPFFLRAGGTGLSNADGVLVAALAIWLASRERFLAAGIVVGAAVWVRYELGLLAFAFVVLGLAVPRMRALVFGAAVFPALYLLAGAAYHGDVLWFLHFPPSITTPIEGLAAHLEPFRRHSGLTLLRGLLSVTPAIVALVLLSPRSIGPLPRALAAFVAIFVAIFAVTHVQLLTLGPLFVLGFAERYAMVLLAAVAPVVALSLEPDTAHDRARIVALGGLLVLGLAALWTYEEAALLGAAGALALAVVLQRAGRSTLAPLPLAALLLAGPWFTDGWLESGGFGRHGRLDDYVAMLDRHADRIVGPIYTNAQLLAPFLERRGLLPEAEIVYLLGPDQIFEMRTLSSDAHDQRDRVHDALLGSVFGSYVDPATLDPSELPPGTAFFLRDDNRLELILPSTTWDPWLELLEEGGRARLYALRREPATAVPVTDSPAPTTP